MGYPKCALCGRGIKGRKRWLSQCFGWRKFPKLTVLRKHLPLSLAALLPGGGRPVMPKEPCLHDGSRGSATGCYAALLEAWHMQDDQTDQAAVIAPNTHLRSSVLRTEPSTATFGLLTRLLPGRASSFCVTYQPGVCNLCASTRPLGRHAARRLPRASTARGTCLGRLRR